MLSKVKQVLENRGKMLKALIVFGSYVYNPLKSRDIDMLVVVDRLADAKEKRLIELDILKNLRSIELRKPIDVVVLDVEMLKENARPGGLLSGLIIGYKVVYDDIGLPRIVEEILSEMSREEGYTIIKRNRRLNISMLAKAKIVMQRDKWLEGF